MDNTVFKVPNGIPQDLLLIQDLVGEALPLTYAEKATPGASEANDDSIDSSGSELDSEEEVEADLVAEEAGASTPETDRSDSETESDSEPESSLKVQRPNEMPEILADVDDEEEGGAVAATAYIQTKNEVVEAEVMIPPSMTVDPHDMLEKVGEIMSIVGNAVIVKGFAAEVVNRAYYKALDADTLLAFDDRSVLGYIYETFGPTSQPLYQIRFNQKFPLDTGKVRVSREVFHVPQQSKFVFMEQLKKMKGSDASNIHDEEPADHEMEFSDDEQEAAFKNRKKKRGHSVASSRASTPVHARTHKEEPSDVPFFGTSNPYAEHGPYDMDFSAPGPSRPPPAPYDDPYADEFKMEDLNYGDETCQESPSNTSHTAERPSGRSIRAEQARGRGRGRGRERGRDRQPYPDSRNSRESSGRTWGGRGSQGSQRSGSWTKSQGGAQDFMTHSYRSYDAHATQPIRPISPVTMPHQFNPSSIPTAVNAAWQISPEVYNSSYVQPHINPRFASAFGMNVNLAHSSWHVAPQQQGQYNFGYAAQAPQNWSDEWNVQHSISSQDSGSFPIYDTSERPAPEDAAP